MEDILTNWWTLASAGLLLPFLIAFFRPSTKFMNDGESTQPFHIYNHPEKKIFDKLVCWLFPFILPLEKLVKYSPAADDNNKERTNALDSIRSKLQDVERDQFKSTCKEWKDWIRSQGEQDDLILGRVVVPRNHSILESMGLVPPTELELKPPLDKSAEVSIELICPRSAIKSGVEFEEAEDEYHSFQQCQLENIVFAESTQLLLWFHGGGMVMGFAKDGALSFGNATKLSQLGTKGAPISIAVLSVAYRLAPENPFPAAIIDGLSACDFLIKQFPLLPLHVAGISAGGNLAAVIGFEFYRSFPGKIKSIMVDAPMVQPRTAELKSYYLQSKSSGVCPVGFLHWAWAAYLQVGEETINYRSRNGLQDALDQSKWSSLDGYGEQPNGKQKGARDDSMFWRLVSPQIDLPTFNAKDAPSILICTATADPLHDEGVELVEMLRKHSCVRIHHFDFKGSHTLAAAVDPEGKAAMIDEWSKSFMESPSKLTSQ
eukprot:scaffold24044_cov127-Cylindrotheca_fusiformis.AAC.1